MSEWKDIKLGDLCYKVCSGGTPKSTCSTYYEGGKIPWLNTKEINYNRIYSTESHITEEGLNNSSAKWIDANSVIVAMYGATAGRVAIAKVPMTTNQACCNLMIDSSKADYNYIYYYLSNSYKQLLSMANGAAQQNLNAQVIKDFVISLPEIREQQYISSILFSLDDKIAVNKKICENLEAQAQALFKHWFVDFAPFKDGKFVESELGLIPEGWRVGKLDELCSFISRGISPKYQLGTNELVLGQTCVRNNMVTLNNAREHQPKVNCNKYVEKWDVLLNSTGIGSLGRVGMIYFNNKNVCFDSHLTLVRTADKIYRYYVGRNLLNRQKELENMAVGSTGQTELPKKDVLVMPILIPNSHVLPDFNEIIENIGDNIYTLIEENQCLSTLRDTLLPKLMSGQIKLSEYE